MDAAAYRAAVGAALAAESRRAEERLERFAEAALADDAAIDGIEIDVFVGQDGEGPFDVWARFLGRDAFRLDRRFDAERRLFGVEWGELGWEPAVPARPRGWTRDALAEQVAAAVQEWLEPLLPAAPPEGFWGLAAH
ncbi:DUF6389 family protein [Leucobacter allii]|uniref:DUF6389 family protein n=1 Tax=Leucobacter allii TaxID=2932247 RepID=UPI001FD5D7AD|nr:DUF6389 family protein [Leucobacter allii]UOR01089.1 DUF6389 family protein [Leucobacter allii]